VAVFQIAISIFILFAEFFVVSDPGFRPLLTPYVVAGAVSGAMLFGRSATARLTAAAWQAIFAATIALNPGEAASAATRQLRLYAMCAALASAYLIVTAIVQRRRAAARIAVRDGSTTSATS
jgi:hypothetical protein